MKPDLDSPIWWAWMLVFWTAAAAVWIIWALMLLLGAGVAKLTGNGDVARQLTRSINPRRRNR